MCGICGILEDGGLGPKAEGWVREMARRQIHRGPDEEGFFVDRFAALGSRRLSIVDLAGGRQPIGSESAGVQVVYNGEIYNYRELREDLQRRGHRFATASDTEVIVHSYEEAGPESLKSFNGMFALAVWDAPRRLLLLARDPLGIKPSTTSSRVESSHLLPRQKPCCRYRSLLPRSMKNRSICI